jgi:hypothetical protein
MISLRIRQVTKDGRTKVWKLTNQTHALTFGTSRKADISSIDAKAESFEGVIEFAKDQWHYITFNTKASAANTCIQKNYSIELAQSTLHFDVFKKDEDVLKQINSYEHVGNQKIKFVVVSRNDRIIFTKALKAKENLPLYIDGHKQKIELIANQEWQTKTINEFKIKYKLIGLLELDKMTQSEQSSFSKIKEEKVQMYAFGGAFLLIMASLVFAQKKPQITAPQAVSMAATKIVLKTNLQKKLKSATRTVSAEAAPSQDSGGHRKSAQLKASVGIRISQLLGKVSATEARTANVILAQKGIKAGEGPSGRALAAIGKVKTSGRNWNGETTGNGGGVSTAGYGGGRGTGSLGGGLGQGRTGSGGVGLIEEESEIVGGLDREVIAQYIKTQLGQILYCYERQLSASPDLYGKIAVKFTIAGTGMVETQAINDTTLKNRTVENCILNKVAKWKFPEPKGGTKVVVTYPFLFKSTN